jgi:hypothetical protein
VWSGPQFGKHESRKDHCGYVAGAVLFSMSNSLLTGVTLKIDGVELLT